MLPSSLAIGPWRRPPADAAFVWDLGAEWLDWTNLPFVFAMWTARAESDVGQLRDRFAEAEIAVSAAAARSRAEKRQLSASPKRTVSTTWKRPSSLLGTRQREGLQRFACLAATHELVPKGARFVFDD